MSSGGNQFSGFKYSGGKNRMAGDYLKDFTERYSDNRNFNEIQGKDYRGNTKNSNVSSFLGNDAPKSVVQQPLGPDSIPKMENVVPNADEFGKDSLPGGQNKATDAPQEDGSLSKFGMSDEEVAAARAAAPALKQVASKSTPHSGSRAAYYATTPEYGQKDNTISNFMKSQYKKWLAAGNVSTDPNAPKFD